MAELSPPFRGPLFVVGMPRCGTKLLRAILNAHPSISIIGFETEFLPYWVINWERFGDLGDRHQFKKFYQSCLTLPFFVYLKDEGLVVDAEMWYEMCDDYSPSGVFEALARVHLGLSPSTNIIWGDKSPSYLTHIALLKRLYPEARFIHIIRDVRDYCLSINRAWGKNMIRAAQRWSDDVACAQSVGSRLGLDYLELKYETLVRSPESTVRNIFDFLAIPFIGDVLNLSRPTENLGDAKGVHGIVEDNTGKYEEAMDSKLLETIESIACETMSSAGYRCDSAVNSVRVSPIRMRLYQLRDGLNLLRFSANERGRRGAFCFVYRYFATSGNRRTFRD